MDILKINPRHQLMERARRLLAGLVVDKFLVEYDLTHAEICQILCEEELSLLRSWVRSERKFGEED